MSVKPRGLYHFSVLEIVLCWKSLSNFYHGSQLEKKPGYKDAGFMAFFPKMLLFLKRAGESSYPDETA